jgi:putative copper export protein
MLALLVFWLARREAREPGGEHRWLWWAGLGLSAWVLLGPSLTGHAWAASDAYPFAVVADWLHLLAAGFWVGGLFHLAMAAPPALEALAPGERAGVLGRVIARFTGVALPSVAVVFLAGLYGAWVQVGSLGALWGTGYGRTLLVKLLLLAPMLALGALNGFWFGPRAGRRASEGGRGGEAVGRGFVRSVRAEAALGALVLLVAAVLVFVTPGRNDAAGGGAATPAERQGRAGR